MSYLSKKLVMWLNVQLPQNLEIWFQTK